MKSCTFFGHRDTKKEIEPTIESTLLRLYEGSCMGEFKFLLFYCTLILNILTVCGIISLSTIVFPSSRFSFAQTSRI